MLRPRIESRSLRPIRNRAFARRDLVVTIATVALLIMLLLAWNRRGRHESDRSSCVHRLGHISRSFNLWAQDHSGLFPMRYYASEIGDLEFPVGTNYFLYFQSISNQLRFPDVLSCPADRQRHYPTNFTTDFHGDRISYFIGLDADRTHANAFLCGDRNISTDANPVAGVLNLTANKARWTSELHGKKGNIALVNGSVAQLNNRELKPALEATGLATNRLALP